MKLIKLGIRFWVTIVSVFSFLGGWILLVHAPKPFQGSSSQPSSGNVPLPTLAPLPPLSSQGFDPNQNSFQQQQQPLFNVQPQPRSRGFSPFFSTGGS